MEEPTTGLHFADIQQPLGGDGGGEIIAEGTLEEIVKIINPSADK